MGDPASVEAVDSVPAYRRIVQPCGPLGHFHGGKAGTRSLVLAVEPHRTAAGVLGSVPGRQAATVGSSAQEGEGRRGLAEEWAVGGFWACPCGHPSPP